MIMTENIKTDNFENFLVEHGFITQEVYDDLKKQSVKNNQSVMDILISEQLLSSESLAQARAAFLNIPYINLQSASVAPEVFSLFPPETINFYKFLPFELNGRILKVAIIDPTNIQALEALEFFSRKQGYSIQLYVTDDKSMDKILSKGAENIEKVVGQALKDIQQKEVEENRPRKEERGNLQTMIQHAPISQIVDVILINAIDDGSSDIHIEPIENELRIRYRIDGVLQTKLTLPKNVANAITSKIKILANLKIDESRLPQDGRFHYNTALKSVDLRVSILPNINGEKIVMRILDKATKPPTLIQLGFRGNSLITSQEAIKRTHGIFLITGPTGSGKSTTLYAILSVLNTSQVNIVTMEDPVEYFLDGVNQSQVNPDIGFTFASGLRSILRQDPNIIMVGEIRDKETAELAVHAALTGHLVFSTLHTNNAIGSLPRLLDMGIEPFLLSASINAVGAQRLCRRICEECKHEVPISPVLKEQLFNQLKSVNTEELQGLDTGNLKLYAGKGCSKCGKTGYHGRVAIVEVFTITNKIQDLIISRASPVQIFEETHKNGMITMKQDGIIKSFLGLTTYEEVDRVTSE